MELGDGREPDDDGQGEGSQDYRTPPPPDDRIWRHPSELRIADSASSRQGRTASWLAVGVAAILASSATVGLLAMLGAFDDERPLARPVVVRPAIAPVDAVPEPSSVVTLAATAQAAVVRLEVDGEASGVGSGVMFTEDGHLITNAHVVDQASRITVVVSDGRRLRGSLVGLDTETDIAVVKITDPTPFIVAVLGSVDDLHVGQLVMAIGSPLGLPGPASVTTGIVSALGRDVEGEDGRMLRDLIQTDASIAPGSSGGALFDGHGLMMGITTAFAVSDVGAEGLGFATAADVARAVAEDLIAGRTPNPGWFGVRGDDAPGGGARLLDIPDGGPADRGGLAPGDTVVELDGRPVRTMSSLRICLRAHRPGEQVEVVYRRGEQRQVAMVTLGDRSND